MKINITSIFHQIEQVKGEILDSLDSNYQPTRVRRGLINTVVRVPRFYLVYDEDAKFLISKISELSDARTNTLNILEAKTRIVRVTVIDINSTLSGVLEERKSMEEVVIRLNEKSGKSLTTLSEIDIRQLFNEQVTIISSACDFKRVI
jgi:hypothetical protein